MNTGTPGTGQHLIIGNGRGGGSKGFAGGGNGREGELWKELT